MDIVLIPGMWLSARSWDEVTPALEQAGHRPIPITLPGLDAADTDRSSITLADWVAAAVAAVDGVPGDRPVAVVGHSAASGVAWAVADARPDRVARAILIGGFPTPSGQQAAGGQQAVGGEIPLPDWSEMDDADLVGLDDDLRARFRAQAVPTPARAVQDEQRLTDERRYDVPVTMICPEFTVAMLREWVADGETPVAEIPLIRQVDYVDLPTGHWPQFSRPADLAEVIRAAVDGPSAG